MLIDGNNESYITCLIYKNLILKIQTTLAIILMHQSVDSLLSHFGLNKNSISKLKSTHLVLSIRFIHSFSYNEKYLLYFLICLSLLGKDGLKLRIIWKLRTIYIKLMLVSFYNMTTGPFQLPQMFKWLSKMSIQRNGINHLLTRSNLSFQRVYFLAYKLTAKIYWFECWWKLYECYPISKHWKWHRSYC
jgi:hypothetical protein